MEAQRDSVRTEEHQDGLDDFFEGELHSGVW